MDRLKQLMESLAVLACQPDQGNNLFLAGRNIEGTSNPSL
jgi:hypothetical protein